MAVAAGGLRSQARACHQGPFKLFKNSGFYPTGHEKVLKENRCSNPLSISEGPFWVQGEDGTGQRKTGPRDPGRALQGLQVSDGSDDDRPWDPGSSGDRGRRADPADIQE